MTLPRSTRSLHRLRDARIADMVRHYVHLMGRDQLPSDFGLTMLHKARRIDAEIRREIEGREGRA